MPRLVFAVRSAAAPNCPPSEPYNLIGAIYTVLLMSSDAPGAVQAKPGCPDKHRAIVEWAMAAMPPAWRLAPQAGEVFDSLQLFEERVRAWSFCDGFEVVRGGGGVSS
jgi:hypothetical protein